MRTVIQAAAGVFIAVLFIGSIIMLRAFWDTGNPMALVNAIWAWGLIFWAWWLAKREWRS